MIGELTQRQILGLADSGAPAAEIAAELQIDEAAVRYVLNAHEAGAPEDRDINDTQLKTLRQACYTLALGAEDESVRARLMMFLIERDKPKHKDATTSPMVTINQIISQGNERYDKLMASFKPQPDPLSDAS